MTHRRAAKLLQGYVNALQPEEKEYKTWDTEIKGFHVKVLPSGTKTYMYTYRLAGKQCGPKIGRHGNITAAQARAKAKDYAAKAAQGMDIQGGINAAKEQAKREKNSTLGAFLESQYKPWTETNHKRGTETMRVLNKEFAHLHGKRLADITQWDARKYEQDKSKAGLSRSTIDRQVRDLKTALSKAAEWGIIESSPLAGMKQGKADKNGRVRYLSEAEEKQLRAALDGRQAKQRIERQQYNQWRNERRMDPLPLMDGRYTDYLEPLVVLAVNTGLRRGELFNLEWADINLKSRLYV
jgi:integrase